MAQPAHALQPKTWDDLELVPEGFVGELVAGEIVANPRPDAPHVDTQSDLGALLGAWFGFGMGGPGGWVIRVEPRVRFGADIRVPDLAGWKKDRFQSPRHGPYIVIPDWVCEVLSAGTAATDRSEKMPLYGVNGVRHAWLVDPIERTVEVYRLTADGWLLVATHAGAAKIRAEPFEAVEIDLVSIWSAAGRIASGTAE